MAILTIRNVPAEVHRALRVRAAAHGRSTEAEIRDILENCVKPEQRLRMGEGPAARRFRIEAVSEVDRQGRWLTCIAKEESLA